MNALFSTEPIRPSVNHGERSVPMRRPRPGEVWPPTGHDPTDPAVVATRLLAVAGRLQTRVHALARTHAVDPYVLRMLLLFAESNCSLRVGNVAELLAVSKSTATRVVNKAQAAGLVDKFPVLDDQREVVIRLSVPGREAATRCLEALRSDAAELLPLATTAPVTELAQLLGPPPGHRRTSQYTGHRVGQRLGMEYD
jgi:DNA-binding MarR family transcriptional regulator